MADGGFFPWKVQKIWNRGPACDYKNIREPLPKPPAGMTWSQDKDSREWKLTKAEQGQQQPPAMAVDNDHQRGMPTKTAEAVAEEHPPAASPEPELREEAKDVIEGMCEMDKSQRSREEEWELLSDRLSNASTNHVFVPRAGSVRSVSSFEFAQDLNGDSKNGNGGGGGSCGNRSTTLSVPFKIQRTGSSSTIDSSDNALGPTGKGILGVDYVEHVVVPSDTLQGICLAYKISSTRLRQANHFSGNSLSLAPRKLVIPLSKTALRSGFIRVQDTDAKEYKIHAVLAEYPEFSMTEARAYLELADWDLRDAMRSAKEDTEWEKEIDGDGSRLKSGEIRITGREFGGFLARGAGIRNQFRKSSAIAATTMSKIVAVKSLGKVTDAMSFDRGGDDDDDDIKKRGKDGKDSSGTEPTAEPIVYKSIPAIATKTVKAQDVYQAAQQDQNFGVELQPVNKPVSS